MKNKTIYSNQCKAIGEVFKDAGSHDNVLCVPVDYAKKAHWALFCDGYGSLLRKAFSFSNDSVGAQTLIKSIEQERLKRKILPEHVIVAGEDVPSWAENLLGVLRVQGYRLMRLNAFQVSKQGTRSETTTDKLALEAIAKELLSRRGNEAEANDVYTMIKESTRHRRRLVQMKTAVSNRIHAYVDKLFPGFLDPKRSGLEPFSKASLALMKDRFSPGELLARREATLVRTLGKLRVRKPAEVAAKLRSLAQDALPPDPASVRSRQRILTAEVGFYEDLEANCLSCEREIGLYLARTPAAIVTSIGGIAIVLAAGIAGETGGRLADPREIPSISTYAGITAKTYQTGGPDEPGSQKGKRKRYNRILRDYLVQAVLKLEQWGPEEIKELIVHRKNTKGAFKFTVALKSLRIFCALMRTQMIYLPPELRSHRSSTEQRAEYIVQQWPKLRRKWERLGILNEAFAKGTFLHSWRELTQEAYDIDLPL